MVRRQARPDQAVLDTSVSSRPGWEEGRDLNDTMRGMSPYFTPNKIGDTDPTILVTEILTPSDPMCHSQPFLAAMLKGMDGVNNRVVFNIVHLRTVPPGANVIGGGSSSP